MSIALQVIGKVVLHILMVVATFLPVKAVLIASDARMPGFIPAALSELGAQVVAVVLGLIAAVAGMIAFFLRKALLTMQYPVRSESLSGDNALGDLFRTRQLSEFSDRFAGRFLIVAFSVLTLLLAWLMFVVAAAVLLVVASWMWFRHRRTDGDQSDVVLAKTDFGDRLARSSTWISVGAAMVAVLVLRGSLGTTELLLAVVLTRQSLLLLKGEMSGIPNLGGDKPLDFQNPNSKNASSLKGQLVEIVAKELALPDRHLRDMGLDGFRLDVHSPTLGRKHLTVMCEHSESGELGLLRYFLEEDRASMVRELSLIQGLQRSGLSAGVPLENWDNGELVGYSLLIADVNAHTWNDKVGQEERNTWQARLEIECLSGTLLPSSARPSHWAEGPPDLNSQLVALTQLPGPLQNVARQLVDCWDSIVVLWRDAPPVIQVSSIGSPGRLRKNASGETVLLEPSEWSVVPFGVKWPAQRDYVSLLEEAGQGLENLPTLLQHAMARRAIVDFQESLRRMSTGDSMRLSLKVLRALSPENNAR